MASISRQPNGHRTIQFVAPDGRRKSLRMGKMNQKAAEAIRDKVEALLAAILAKIPPDQETARWVGQIPDRLAHRLAKAGLIAPRAQADQPDAMPLLGAFLRDYIEKQLHHKTNTRKTIEQAERVLVAYFGADKPLDEISAGDAEDWRNHLRAETYKPASVGTYVKKARQMFAYAVAKKFVPENPFAGLKVPVQADKSREVFVTHETIKQALAACPDAEWRLLLALSRFGGLRCPSEHLALKWTDVDWERDRFRVDSSKTGERWVPIFSELRPFLEEAFELAQPGAVYVVTRYRDARCNLRTQFMRILRRAGLEPWQRLFHNLRSSRQTELTETFPAHVVSAWMGNTVKVATRHYLQTTDAHFERAAKSGAQALQNPVQLGAAAICTEPQETRKAQQNPAFAATFPGFCASAEHPWQESNHQGGISHCKCCNSNDVTSEHDSLSRAAEVASAAKSGAFSADFDSELARLIAAWPTLAPDVRAAILALAEGGRP